MNVNALLILCLGAAAAGATGAAAAVERQGDAVVLSGPAYRVAFSTKDGSLLSATQAGKDGPLCRSGEQGLWRLRFREGGELLASAFGTGERTFTAEPDAAGNVIRMRWNGPEASITVTATGRADGVDLVGEVAPKEKTVLDFVLPARLRFDPERAERLVFPMNGNFSVGTAFNASFFKLQPQENPSAWRPQSVGTAGYVSLFGGPLDQRPDGDAPVALKATDAGREWLGAALAQRVDASQGIANRPCTREQAELNLVDSANGPYYSGSRLGGQGVLWRIGGRVSEKETDLAQAMVAATIRKLAESAPAGRTRVGLIALRNGPDRGGWAGVSVSQWRGSLSSAVAATGGKLSLVEIATAKEMMDALADGSTLAVLNPYGEWAPVLVDEGMPATTAAVGRFVRGGGNWFEVGGYPFFYEMRPVRYLGYSCSYPAAFADFLHLDGRDGTVSVYRVQPLPAEPWAGARDKSLLFVPGALACGADEGGGHFERGFGTFVKPGETWRAPAVRLVLGQAAPASLRAYCEANGIRRRLSEKMRPDVLAKFRNSVLVYYAGSAREKTAHLDQLPVPTQVHFADYLKGGFDKEYPDHLPPKESFGTPAEFRAFFDRCRQLGHLVVPYTNPTWWCDGPKGPTFEREGDAPLLRNLDGKLSHERYAANEGFTVCHWHPAVRAANEKTVRQFTEEYPVDILFQDQNGARSWRYDLNPASPTPYAYIDGLLSMVMEDSRRVPLSTESGWDRVANYHAQLCGMSWQIVPTEGGPEWRRLMKESYPVTTWEVFPLAQCIAHDKAAMIHHDLGQFITNREVLAWSLGLGYSMSYRVAAGALGQDAPREWLRWLDRIQKSICARYVGEGIQDFDHDRGPAPTQEDDGTIRATYGPVALAANLGPDPRTVDGRKLAGHGFYASAPGMVAGTLSQVGAADFGPAGVSFVTEGSARKADVWVYGPGEAQVAVPLPEKVSGDVTVTFDGQPAAKVKAQEGVVALRLPARGEKKRMAPPAALSGKAPLEWPGGPPAIGILDLGAGVGLSWTRITAEEWVKAFQESRLARERRVPVRRLTTPAQVVAAVDAGPTAWLAIVNPYGEVFPVPEPGKWREFLGKVRAYVNNGGCWWETGGYSFHGGVAPAGDGWQRDSVGPSGMGFLGLPVGGGEVDQAPEPLRVPAEGRNWLGAELTARVEKLTSSVNRGLSRGREDPGHVALVAGARSDFIGGYRLDGWGWLWRIGGFYPNPEVALPIAVAAMEHVYTHPPLPVKAGGVHFLWHAVVRW